MGEIKGGEHFNAPAFFENGQLSKQTDNELQSLFRRSHTERLVTIFTSLMYINEAFRDECPSLTLVESEYQRNFEIAQRVVEELRRRPNEKGRMLEEQNRILCEWASECGLVSEAPA